MQNDLPPDPQPARRDLRLIRLYYFLFLGGSGFLWPFLNLFYVRLGLSGTQIGWISALASVVGLVSAPLWTSAAHKRANSRPLLQGMQTISSLSIFFLGMQTAYLPILGLTFLRAAAASGISPMADAIAIQVIGATQTGYGSVRIWASVGWVIFTLSAGWLIESYGIQVSFWGAALTGLAAAGTLFFIRPQAFKRRSQGAPEAAGGSRPGRSNLKPALQTIASSPPMVGAALMMIVTGLGNNGILQFENVYLNTLGASESLLGVAGVLSAIVEIPFMLLADRLLRRGPAQHSGGRLRQRISAQRLLMLSLLITGSVRLLVLAFPSIQAIMLARAINGVGFAFYTIALIKFLSEQSPPEQTGTILALYTVTLAGLIGLVGSPISGAFYDAYPTRWLYLVAALGYGLGALMMLGRKNKSPGG